MAAADAMGRRAAARVFAAVMKRVAAVKTKKGADAVRVTQEGNETVIAAGRPAGRYGWEPIEAAMFDDDGRHPLFGNKRHWYREGRYPITELTERTALGRAVDAYADTALPELFREHGFTDN